MPGWRVFVPAMLGQLLLACATPSPDLITAAPPRPIEIEGAPFFPQQDRHCGPAALATVLTWAGHAITPADTTDLVYTPGRGGSLQHDLITGAARFGAVAVQLSSPGDLLRELDAGRPVLVLQNLGLPWIPIWHYAVVVGFDPDSEELLLRSGRERLRRTPLGTFARTWARADHWGLLVLPAGSIPGGAGEGPLLRAAATLERVGRSGEAEATYRAALERWPTSHGAWLGLANARHSAGDMPGAEAALVRAAHLHPLDPVAWNNLGHVLNVPGRRMQALALSSRAVGLGGAHLASARHTREEIIAALAACHRQGIALARC